MIEKRYQVFVSSTYADLRKERQAISRTLLEINCIPVGMEIFPAADDDQWTVIKRLIDDCDYFLVIIGGRYGSIGPDGVSYTEMEYKYALKARKPIIAFIHHDIDKLPQTKKQNKSTRKKLDSFVELAKRKMVRFWKTPDDLRSIATSSLVHLVRTNPAAGLVKPNGDGDVFVLRGYNRVMSLLEDIATNARYRLWTARTHLGKGTGEDRYFEIIRRRLIDETKPLEDFRRVIRLCSNARTHLVWMVDNFCSLPNARVSYYEFGGPQFDFMSVDGEIAVIGFPMAGGKGNVGAVVLRRADTVAAIETVFQSLEVASTLLFEGVQGIDAQGKRVLRGSVDKALLRACCN